MSGGSTTPTPTTPRAPTTPPTRPTTRRPLVVLALAALALALVPPPARSAPAVPVRGAEDAFADIAGCIAGADNVLVSIVVDESASLQQTDPGDLRVRGISAAVDSLDQLAASLGESTRLHASLSTFARSFDTLVGWRRLDGGTTGPLRDAAREQLADRDNGDATDYRQALQGARRLLEERQRQVGDPDACEVMLWFTDGALDVDDATATAASQLCQVGGILDSVRRDDIAVVALALFNAAADVTQAQREQLRSVAEGRGRGTTCGTVPVPAQNTSGIYLPADDPAALQELFGRAGALVGGGTPVASVTCPGPQCPGGRYPLAIDPGVAGARLLVSSRQDGVPDVEVTGPSGPVDLSGGTAEVDGATVSLLRRDGFATLDISYPRYAEERVVWQVRPGRSDLSVFWFWGARLELGADQRDSVQAGERNDLTLQLLDRTGAPLDPTLYDGFRVDASLGEREVRARVTRDGAVTATVDLGVDGLPPALPLRVSVTAESRPGAVPLGPLSLSGRLPVELPPVYPGVSPDEVDFGALEGAGTASAELTATGSRRGPTRVCVVRSRITVPGRAAADLVRAGRECVRVERGGAATIPLRLSPRATADGLATGRVTLSLEPADGSAPLQVEVPVELQMQRVVDESTRWLLVALLVGLALLLPLALLALANWLTAAFAMTSLSRVGSAPVRVTPRGLEPRDGGALITPDHFDNAGFSGRRRERCMTLGRSGITAQVRGAWGVREAQGVAVGPPGRLLVSGLSPHRGRSPGEAPMALGDVDSTFVVVERVVERVAGREETTGTLVVVVPARVVDEAEILERVRELSDRVDWEAVLAEAAPEPAPNPVGAPTSARSGGPARGSGHHATAEAGRASFPWEAEPDRATGATGATGATPTARRKSGSGGGGRRTAPESSQDGPDDALPPLPDFLKED